HKALYLLTACLLDSLVADLTDKHGHSGAGGKAPIDSLDGVGHALPVAVPRLKHVKVDDRCIVNTIARAARRMNGNRMMMRICLMHVASQLSQAMFLCVGVFFWRF